MSELLAVFHLTQTVGIFTDFYSNFVGTPLPGTESVCWGALVWAEFPRFLKGHLQSQDIPPDAQPGHGVF